MYLKKRLNVLLNAFPGRKMWQLPLVMSYKMGVKWYHLRYPKENGSLQCKFSVIVVLASKFLWTVLLTITEHVRFDISSLFVNLWSKRYANVAELSLCSFIFLSKPESSFSSRNHVNNTSSKETYSVSQVIFGCSPTTTGSVNTWITGLGRILREIKDIITIQMFSRHMSL